MRRKVTLNLDEDFIERLDRDRGDAPRSRWIETLAKPTLALPKQEASGVPSPTRSPAPESETIPSREELQAHIGHVKRTEGGGIGSRPGLPPLVGGKPVQPRPIIQKKR